MMTELIMVGAFIAFMISNHYRIKKLEVMVNLLWDRRDD